MASVNSRFQVNALSHEQGRMAARVIRDIHAMQVSSVI